MPHTKIRILIRKFYLLLSQIIYHHHSNRRLNEQELIGLRLWSFVFLKIKIFVFIDLLFMEFKLIYSFVEEQWIGKIR